MTLAQARRQVRRRRVVGVGLLVLALAALLFALVKNLYLTLPYGISPGVDDLRRLIYQLLLRSSILAWLWQVTPTWTPSNIWTYLYLVWSALVVIYVGGALLRSARDRQAQIRLTRQELEREGWKRDARGDVERPRAPQTRVIDQHPAPAEPWSRKPYGIVGLGVAVTVVGGLLLHLLKTLLFANAR
jgi:ferric-dicitrate binding protein FerR (iron transport regulator)